NRGAREGRGGHHQQRPARSHQGYRRIVTLSINGTQPPLADKRARQALHYALDVGSIIRNLYAGQGKPFSGGVADTDFGYNPALKPYPFDPAKARQLLAEAGRLRGIDVTLSAGRG